MKFRSLLLLSSLLILSSCKKDPAGPDTGTPPPAVVKAVYVLNEGDFSDASGARLTLYDVDKDSLYHDVYENANGGTHLGNVGDDMKIHKGKAYIVMSGSKNLIVLNLTTHRKESEIVFPGSAVHDLMIDSVRNRLYITRLFSRSVYVLNLTSLQIEDSVAVGANPQGMALVGERLYVCNSGYGADNTLSVVDLITLRVVATITTGDGPTNAAVAADKKIWVACTGNAFGSPSTTGSVYVIDPATNAKTDSILFAENLWGAMSIGTDGYAYVLGTTSGSFFGGPVHRISVSTKAVVSNFIAGTYYGLAFDEVAREVYVTDVKSFSGNGDVKIYSTAGALRKSFTAQKGPAVIAFKR